MKSLGNYMGHQDAFVTLPAPHVLKGDNVIKSSISIYIFVQ